MNSVTVVSLIGTVLANLCSPSLEKGLHSESLQLALFTNAFGYQEGLFASPDRVLLTYQLAHHYRVQSVKAAKQTIGLPSMVD